MTGAGVSTPSGIPDYRSLKGIYHGIEAPEYLLSHTCMVREPDKFYQFVKHLYHPEAKPNVIHQTMAEFAQERNVWVVSQNIDGLHQQAGSQTYLTDWHHADCGGQIRPAIVLYEEGFSEETITAAINAVANAQLVVVVGTSLQVYPFAGLLQYQNSQNCLIINQTMLEQNTTPQVLASGETVFAKLSH